MERISMPPSKLQKKFDLDENGYVSATVFDAPTLALLREKIEDPYARLERISELIECLYEE